MAMSGFAGPNQKFLYFMGSVIGFHVSQHATHDRAVLNPTLHGLSLICFGDEMGSSTTSMQTSLIC